MDKRTTTPFGNGSIGYLFIEVRDFERMVSFYRDTLGLELTYLESGSCAFFRLKVGQPEIALISGRQTSDCQNHWFIVINVDDVRLAVKKLTLAGIKVGEICDVPWGEAAKFYDPECNVIEVHQFCRPEQNPM